MIKYIGQHIFDFISRFRNDVYIVNKDTDKEHKISTSTNSLDVTIDGASVSGVRLLRESQTDPVFDFNVGRAYLNMKDDTGGGNPNISLTTGANIASGTSVTFTKGRISGGSIVAGQDDDIINTILYKSYNDAVESLTFAQVQAQIADASDTDEAGYYDIQVTTSDGSTSALQNAFKAQGSPSANDVDVTIGHGSTSVVTVPGRVSTNRVDWIGSAGITSVQISSASFSDNDTSLMTSAAIDDRINAATGGGAVSVASGSQAAVGMQIARRTITQAEANSMHSTPIELIPAQGANTIIEVANVIARADRAATQTNSALTMDLHYADKEPGTYGAASLAHFRRFMYNKTTDIVERRVVSQTVSGVTLTEDVNKAVEVSFSSAATTNCFTSLDMYVTYFVIDIS